MEVVDPEVSVTCMDLTHVRKTFQLALLCTKRFPCERPTMHEVARVLVSFLPPPPAKPCLAHPKSIDYTEFVAGKGLPQVQQGDNPPMHIGFKFSNPGFGSAFIFQHLTTSLHLFIFMSGKPERNGSNICVRLFNKGFHAE
ncbi:hypothetical protein RND71_018659 [Anisodus tanguticus]|uniref:Uncharacterized protein n=1 Tax=Anisodus tanguticus TaxID=243964 RepID=A0AAE1S4K1_9SOLA|nr:hypothetical protein RND71_018659 [Anisodus tanguticus]